MFPSMLSARVTGVFKGFLSSPPQDDQSTEPLTYGRIASYYYLKHQTIRTFKERLRAELPIHELLSVLTVSFVCSQVIPAHSFH